MIGAEHCCKNKPAVEKLMHIHEFHRDEGYLIQHYKLNCTTNNRLFMAPHLVRAQSTYKDIRIHSFHHTHTDSHTHNLHSLSLYCDQLNCLSTADDHSEMNSVWALWGGTQGHSKHC